MRSLPRIPPASALALVLLLPAPAAAEVPSRGMTLELGLGANGVTDDDYMELGGNDIDLDPLVGLHLAALYRFLPFLSAGLVLHYGFISADGESYDDEYSDFLGVVAAARGHYGFGRFEHWAELGIGYAMAHTSARGSWWILEGEGFMALHGVGFDLALGVNIYVTDSFALGPFFRMIVAAWPKACYELETEVGDSRSHEDDCDEIDDIYDPEPDDLPHLWVVGVELSNTF